MLNNYHSANSILKVTASESLDISNDLETISNKTISELLDEEKEEQETTTE